MSRFATRLTATAVAAGALLAAAALPAAAAGGRGPHHPQRPQHAAVVLGAIQYDSPGQDNGSGRSLNAEWVTVTNTARSAVNLSGWTLTGADHHHTYRFNHLSLGGHQSVRVHTGVGHNTSRDVFQDSRTYLWGNVTDTATLRDGRGHLVNSKSWGHHVRRGQH
jgi:Lamin Tail Domain